MDLNVTDVPDLSVTDAPERSRFELRLGGDLVGFADYVVAADGVMAIPHTEVDSAQNGRGLGSELVRGALDTIAARGQQVLPQCPFVAFYIGRHPSYAALVPPQARQRYGIAEPA